MAKVLKDGNLLIFCRTKEQIEQTDRVKETSYFKVLRARYIGKGIKWSKSLIWGVPIGVTLEENKSDLNGGILKDAQHLQLPITEPEQANKGEVMVDLKK